MACIVCVFKKCLNILHRMAGTNKEFHLKVIEPFQQALKYTLTPKKQLAELMNMFYLDSLAFTEAICSIAFTLVSNFDANPQAERGLKLIIALFEELKPKLCSFDSQDLSKRTFAFYDLLLRYMCEGILVPKKSVRVASSMVLYKFLALGVHELLEFPDELHDLVCKNVGIIIKDKCKEVRANAIRISAILKTLPEYFPLCILDPFSKNRKLAIELIEDRKLIDVLGEGLYTVDKTVQVATLQKILAWGCLGINIKYYRKVFLLANLSRESAVKKYAKEVIKDTIEKIGIYEVFKKLEMESFDIKKQKYFIQASGNLLSEVPQEQLEALMFNDLLKDFLGQNGGICNWVLTSLIVRQLCNAQQNAILTRLPAKNLIMLISMPLQPIYIQKLIEVCMCLDLGDEEIRGCFVEQLLNLCKTIELNIQIPSLEKKYMVSYDFPYFANDTADLLHFTVRSIKDLVDQNPNEFSSIMSDVINDIRDPLNSREEDGDFLVFIENTQCDPSLQEKKEILVKKFEALTDTINELQNQKEALIDQGSYEDAYKIHNQIEEHENEQKRYEEKLEQIDYQITQILTRALIIAIETLKELKNGIMHYDLWGLIESIVDPSLRSTNITLNILGVECLNQCCIHKLEIFIKYFDFLTNMLINCKMPSLQMSVLEFWFDMYMVHDMSNVQKSYEEFSNENIITHLLKYFNSTDDYIRTFAIEGVSKLVVNGIIKSPIPLAHLMIHYYDSNTPGMTQQFLQSFFPNFSILRPQNAEIMVEAFKLVMEFLNALQNNNEILNDYFFNTKKIFQFVYTSTSSSFLRKFGKIEPVLNLNLDIFFFMCKKIMDSHDSYSSDLYYKLLPLADISEFTDKEIAVCKKILSKVLITKALKKIMEVIDKRNLQYIPADDLEDKYIERWITTQNLIKKFAERFETKDRKKLMVQYGRSVGANGSTGHKRKSLHPAGSDIKKLSLV